MKTAMKEMVLNIESIESKTSDQEQIYMLTALKIGALVLLEKEKKQIIEARESGLMDGVADYVLTEWGKDSEILTSEEYYKQKYKTPPCSGHAFETE